MAKLTNELSWSRSRVATLRWCKRQYYYQYYQKWGGWDWDAEPERKKAYFFSKMTDLAMLVGDVVHQTIKKCLEDLRDHGDIRLPDPALHVRLMLTQVWRDAEAERWRQSIKNHPPVFEIYYRQKPAPEELKAIGQRAVRCIQSFLASDLVAALRRDDPRDWLAIDVGPSFDDDAKHKVDGITVWALPDFVRRVHPNGCEIWDWKTGAPSPHDGMQLLSYALQVRDRMGFFGEDIRLKAFYLGEGRVADYPCSTAKLDEITSGIRSDFALMQSLLADPATNTPAERDLHFPMSEDPTLCRRCSFKELCER
jgi:hypothetical protein